MAGFANTKVRLQEALAENETLKAELARYRRANAPKAQRIVSRSYDAQVIEELIGWSEEGLFLDECLANWGIDRETWDVWLRTHDSLKAAAGPARARAKAAMLRTLREALKTRSAFPTSLADRIIAMVEKESATAEGSGADLIRIEVTAGDQQSPQPEAQALAASA